MGMSAPQKRPQSVSAQICQRHIAQDGERMSSLYKALGNKDQLKMVVAGLVGMSMLGFVYTWSIFLQPIEQELGWTRSDVVFTFNLIMMFFPVGIMLAGVLNKILSLRATYLLAAVCFPAGFFVLSFIDSLMGMYLLCGVVGGIFFGVVYNIVLYVSNLYFPNNTGVISGLMQASLGVSTLFWGKFAECILSVASWRVGIRYMALMIMVMIVLSSVQMRKPKVPSVEAGATTSSSEVADVHWRQMLREKDFWLFWITRATIVAGGVGIFGNAVPIAMENGAVVSQAVFALGLMSVSNALGRLLFGIVWDALGAKRTIISNCIVFAGSFAALMLAGHSFAVLLAAFVFCGLSYGGITVLGVSFNKGYYGVKYFQENYGWTTTATIVAGFIGPSLLAYYKTNYGTYASAYYAFLVGALVAMACILFLKDKKHGCNQP